MESRFRILFLALPIFAFGLSGCASTKSFFGWGDKSAPPQAEATAQVIDPEVLRSAMALSTLLAEGVSLRFEPEGGLVLEDIRGWKAYFGAGGDMDEKARVYIRIGTLLQEQ